MYKLTLRGAEAKIMLLPTFSQEEIDSIILIGLVQKNNLLDYFDEEIPYFCLCPCTFCKKNIQTRIGGKAHKNWIKTKQCALCRAKEVAIKLHAD